jgi:1-acyl-sn-glycerol-3-phosphate acyltransferase
MDRPERAPWLYTFCRRVFRAWLTLAHGYRSHGRERVPRTGPFVLATNHASYLDPMVAGCALYFRHIRFMARDTLAHSRLLGWWMRQVGAVLIDRSRGDVAGLKESLRVLRQGGVICLFPEGTRTTTGRLQPPKGGVGFLIAKAGVPVVPAYVSGTFRVMPKGVHWPRPGRVAVRYGEPIRPEDWAGFGAGRDAFDKIGALVMDRIAALQQEAGDAPPSPAAPHPEPSP